eukprot:625952-Karenia_brevis.AAC.1
MITTIADANFASETIIEIDDTENPTPNMAPTMECWRRLTDKRITLQGEAHLTQSGTYSLQCEVHSMQ